MCSVNGIGVPDTISIIPDRPTKEQHTTVRVTRITQQPRQYMFTACVSPLHSQFNNTDQLTQWIELNKILGVEKFIAYVTDVTKHAMNVLNYYVLKGVVTVLPWRLPHTLSDMSLKLVHYNGQIAALNDCLYRSKGKSKYITSIDLDELIIPQMDTHVTWSDLMSSLPISDVYIFQCSFFTKRKKCGVNNKCRDSLIIDSNVYRDNIVLTPPRRSKYIALTSSLITMGIHKVANLSDNSCRFVVPMRLALLHHYRQKRIAYTRHVAYNQTKHNVASKYSYELQKNLAKMRTDFRNFDKPMRI